MQSSSELQQPEAPTVGNELDQTVAQVLLQAVNSQRSGQLQKAEEFYRAILEIKPAHPDANHNLGVLIATTQQSVDSLPYFRAALEAAPEHEQYWLSYVDALIRSAQPDAAGEILELGKRYGLRGPAVEELAGRLKVQPQAAAQANAVSQAPVKTLAAGTEKRSQKSLPKAPSTRDINKLTSLRRKGRAGEIEAFAKGLTARFPEHGLGWKTLGSILEKQERIDEALQPLQKAVELLPKDPEVHNNLGVVLQKKVRLAEAEKLFYRALELKPDFPAALNNLGNLHRIRGRLADSEASFRRALELEPSPVIYNNLGATLLDQGRIAEAENCYRLALKIKPDSALAHVNLGVSLRYQGRLNEAIASQRRALALNPDCPEQHSNLLFTLNYTSGDTDALHLEEARKYGRMVSRKAKAPFSAWQCSPRPERLRVGLVSGDLYNHPVGFFLESLLGQLDPERIELIAYPTNHKADDLTARIKPRFAAWKPLFGLSDEVAAQTIHADGVHVLLDLSGHTSHNRLPMFAWKPAPVQCSWLGYFATTGVAEVDYFLADEVGVPESQRDNFTETLWYLPDTRLCFTAPQVDLPVAPLPALENGQITFGCFQKLTKVSDEVLRVWSSILAALPEARIRWQCAQLGDPTVAELFTQRLQRQGIDPERVSLQGSVPRARYLAAHAGIDVILDTFPYPGGTTTCEALWMGVPTLTLAGNTLLARQGASLLTAAGLGEWVADSEEGYVAKAVALAGDLPRLAKLRAGLRAQVLASPLFDAPRFARHFQAALWEMWQERQPQQKPATLPDQTLNKRKNVSEDQVMNFFSPVFWGTRDPDRFTDLMREASQLTNAYHFGDNMFLFQRNNSMFNDQPFVRSWESNALTPSDRTIVWRRYILAMAGFHCMHLEGDFVECGAYQGVGAKTVLDYLGGKDFPKTFWLYDVFEHAATMVNHAMQHHGPRLHAQVVQRFADYPNVKIFKGFLPQVLDEGCPDKIAYLHIDLNQAPAEIATLDALFDKVVPGGMIILDDYEMLFYRAQKLAEDDWFGKRGYKVFPLPTSQGFVIKR